MAWLDRLGKLPSTTLIRSAVGAAMIGLAALGVGIGAGCAPLLGAAYAVLLLAGLVPAAGDWRDSKPRHEAPDRPGAAQGGHAPRWDIAAIERKTAGRPLVWFEPQADRNRLH